MSNQQHAAAMARPTFEVMYESLTDERRKAVDEEIRRIDFECLKQRAFNGGYGAYGDIAARFHSQSKNAIQASYEAQQAEQKQAETWPKKGDRYYYLNSFYAVREDTWDGGEVDRNRLAVGNVYGPEADAVRYRDRMQARHHIESRARELNAVSPWQNDYYVYAIATDGPKVWSISMQQAKALGMPHFHRLRDANAVRAELVAMNLLSALAVRCEGEL